MITATASAFVLYVNMSIPKKEFPTMQQCMAFKGIVEKRIAAHYNPVNLLIRVPTISCAKVSFKRPVKKETVKKDIKKTKHQDKKK